MLPCVSAVTVQLTQPGVESHLWESLGRRPSWPRLRPTVVERFEERRVQRRPTD